MKKRLRKKLKLGEFTEYGFPVRATILAIGPAGITLNLPVFGNNFLTYCESQGLGYGGNLRFGSPSFGGGIDGFVTSLGWRDRRGRWHSGSCTSEDRRLVMRYLGAKAADGTGLVDDVWVGPLVDVKRAEV